MRNLKGAGKIASILVMLCAAVPLFAQEKQKIRMVYVSLAWNSEIPFRAALSRGYFKQQGLQVEPILIRGGPAAIAALVSGEVDFAAIGGAQAVFRSRARGLDLSIIGCTSSTTNYILLGDKQTRESLSEAARRRALTLDRTSMSSSYYRLYHDLANVHGLKAQSAA